MRLIVTLICLGFLFIGCQTDGLSAKEKKEVMATLNQIKTVDQQFAGLPPTSLQEKYGIKKAWDIFLKQRDSVSLLHQQQIQALFEKYGYLGYKEVGKEGERDFWIVAQHADNNIPFQQQMLAAMKEELTQQNADSAHYAMLEDRVNVNLNKPQRFGSQVTYNQLGQAIPKIGLQDSLNVESLRATYQMPTFKEYYNSMTQAHFEMNKAYLQEQGILEPKLYQ